MIHNFSTCFRTAYSRKKSTTLHTPNKKVLHPCRYFWVTLKVSTQYYQNELKANRAILRELLQISNCENSYSIDIDTLIVFLAIFMEIGKLTVLNQNVFFRLNPYCSHLDEAGLPITTTGPRADKTSPSEPLEFNFH